jgi:transcription-repair coupling factor (superfamily II helicase)
MEASFLYEDTPDQRRATEDVKKDMESSRPMDRLLCGDVGFGKTEVAVRAAFKAVQDGKQVAVLAPTTILVEQHRRTFEERLADYPVKVGALSRFRGAGGRTRRSSRSSRKGEVDIVIGTHRLLSGTCGSGTRAPGGRRGAALRREAQGTLKQLRARSTCSP